MIKQALKLSKEKLVAIEIEPRSIRMELENSSGAKLKMELSLDDLEELTDLMMDCFYKASQVQHQLRKEEA